MNCRCRRRSCLFCDEWKSEHRLEYQVRQKTNYGEEGMDHLDGCLSSSGLYCSLADVTFWLSAFWMATLSDNHKSDMFSNRFQYESMERSCPCNTSRPNRSVRHHWNERMVCTILKRNGVTLFIYRAFDHTDGRKISLSERFTNADSRWNLKGRRRQDERAGLPDMAELADLRYAYKLW